MCCGKFEENNSSYFDKDIQTFVFPREVNDKTVDRETESWIFCSLIIVSLLVKNFSIDFSNNSNREGCN